jgi:CHASE3 domain sensor protein
VPSRSARWRSGSTNSASRASELEEATAGQPSLEVSESRLEEIVSAFREALETGSPAQRKALIKTLVAEIRVNGAEAFPF